MASSLHFTQANSKSIHLIFRFDDYSAVSNTTIEKNLLEIFEDKKFPITFAVIPYATDKEASSLEPSQLIEIPPDKIKILKEGLSSGFLEIGLHGYNHKTIRLPKKTEFQGLNCKEQERRIQSGKRFLEDRLDSTIGLFVPPWNSYDGCTLGILEKEGFGLLSADKKGSSRSTSHLRYLPYSLELHQLRNSIEAARNSPDQQPLIVVMFHHYDFRESEAKGPGRAYMTMDSMRELLDWISTQPDIKVISFSEADKTIQDLSSTRLGNNAETLALRTLFQKNPTDPLYRERSIFGRTLMHIGGMILGFLILGAGLMHAAKQAKPDTNNYPLIFTSVATLLYLAWSLRHLNDPSTPMMAFRLSLIMAGGWFSMLLTGRSSQAT